MILKLKFIECNINFGIEKVNRGYTWRNTHTHKKETKEKFSKTISIGFHNLLTTRLSNLINFTYPSGLICCFNEWKHRHFPRILFCFVVNVDVELQKAKQIIQEA